MNVEQVLRELERELQTRETFYPGWVTNGRITRKTADHRLEAIRQAIHLIEASQKPKTIQLPLLGGIRHD